MAVSPLSRVAAAAALALGLALAGCASDSAGDGYSPGNLQGHMMDLRRPSNPAATANSDE